MIYWAPFLHFYQPPTQFHAVLKKICNESYRPLIKMFLEHPNAKVTINLCGVLTEMLNDHGADDILEGIKQLASNRQLEFVDSAKYHPILPLIPQKEIERQIRLNFQTNAFFFKDLYKPKGFFPPEMCYSEEVAKVVPMVGLEWILLSGIACSGEWPSDFISKISVDNSSLRILFRDDILSNKISFRSLDSIGFLKEIIELTKSKKDAYIITAMDAETFGHHIHHWEEIFLEKVYETIDVIENVKNNSGMDQIGELADAHKKIFVDLEGSPDIKVVTISELIKIFPLRQSKDPRSSSWSTSKEDFAAKNYYPLWKDKGNIIHDLLWEHLNLCFDLVNEAFGLKADNKDAGHFAIIARGLLDRAVHSCQFWWANKNRGMWDINLINKGLMLQEEARFNAFKAINISSLDSENKKEFQYKVSAARDIANRIRELLVGVAQQ